MNVGLRHTIRQQKGLRKGYSTLSECEGRCTDHAEIYQTCRDDDCGVIKDSGQRQEFETGAVRDITPGKGMPHLMPLGIVSWIVNDDDFFVCDPVLMALDDFLRTGRVTDLGRAIKHFCRKRDISVPMMMIEVSKHFENGAKKYGVDNWKKGIPESSYVDSAVRHYLKWLDGWTDEPHDRAFVWNCICLWWTRENITEKEGASE